MRRRTRGLRVRAAQPPPPARPLYRSPPPRPHARRPISQETIKETIRSKHADAVAVARGAPWSLSKFGALMVILVFSVNGCTLARAWGSLSPSVSASRPYAEFCNAACDGAVLAKGDTCEARIRWSATRSSQILTDSVRDGVGRETLACKRVAEEFPLECGACAPPDYPWPQCGCDLAVLTRRAGDSASSTASCSDRIRWLTKHGPSDVDEYRACEIVGKVRDHNLTCNHLTVANGTKAHRHLPRHLLRHLSRHLLRHLSRFLLPGPP